jgi:hypothetical protein
MSSIPDHQDDIGEDPVDHVLPTDPIMTQNGVVVILDAAACVGGCPSKRFIHPSARHLTRNYGRVETDDVDLVSGGKGWRLTRPRLMVDALVMLSIKTTEVILRFLALDPVDVTAGSLLGRGAGIHHY